MSERCPICGETSPEPQWLCVPRMIGSAQINKPCDYSQEGEARVAEALSSPSETTPEKTP